jgi:predicted DNA-binding transcriptional regulator AlpA
VTDTVRITEIAQMLGITRPRASQLSRTAGFPAPVKTQRRSKWWNREEIEAWARRHGRSPAVSRPTPEGPTEADLDRWTSAVEVVRDRLAEGREKLATANREGRDIDLVWVGLAKPSVEALASIGAIALEVDRPTLARRVIDTRDGSWTAYRNILDALEQLLTRFRLIRRDLVV